MTETTEQIEGGYCSYKPTRGERIARALGFRFHLGNDPNPDDEPVLDWRKTGVAFRFTLLDRLRLLVSGRLNVWVVTEQAARSTKVFTRHDWKISAPWEDNPQ